jgi:hypothetical protein
MITTRFLPAALLVFTMTVTSSRADATHYCYYDGKRYEFTVTTQQQARCPKWDTEKDANPPLSAAKALAKAKEFIATIKTKDRLSWEFEDLALANIDGWMWRARYRLTNNGVMTGVWPRMECWILMDGTVIQPRTTKDKK